METTLNLIWVLVTIAAAWMWRYRWSLSRQSRQHSSRTQVIAIICVLALLFPVISLTDDLHPEIVPADTVSSKRNQCLLNAGIAHVANSKSTLQAHAVYALLPNIPVEVVRAHARVTIANIAFHISVAAFSGFGRAPPSLA